MGAGLHLWMARQHCPGRPGRVGAVSPDVGSARAGIEGCGGNGSNVLGNPRNALTWIAQDLRRHRRGLRAGEIVTTGTTTAPVPVGPGDEVRRLRGTTLHRELSERGGGVRGLLRGGGSNRSTCAVGERIVTSVLPRFGLSQRQRHRRSLFTTGQQVGGAVGLALLTAVATTRTSNLLAAGVPEAEAVTMGWSLGFVVCVGLVLAGLLITITMIRPAPPPQR